MTARARTTALLGALGLMVAVLFGASPAPAGAAPYTAAASIGVSVSDPCQGASHVVSGSGFVPGSTVTIRIGDTVVGRAKVGADGTFRITVKAPAGLRGTQTETASSPTGRRTASTQITIRVCGSGAAPTGVGRSPDSAGAGDLGANDGQGGLSDTGVAVLGLLVVAVVLVGAGGALIVGGRRRRSGAGRAA